MAVDQPYEYEVFLLDLDSDEPPERLTYGLLGIGGSLDWSPDGRYLLIAAGPPGDKDIFRIDVDTDTVARLTFGGNNNSPAYSPDGQWIVFNSLRNNDQADLYLMRSDGSALRQLTTAPEPDWQPEWEP
jgi:TolB protein